jgi:hypothetical protein
MHDCGGPHLPLQLDRDLDADADRLHEAAKHSDADSVLIEPT